MHLTRAPADATGACPQSCCAWHSAPVWACACMGAATSALPSLPPPVTCAEMVRGVAPGSVDAIVAIGGDGTMHEVLQGMLARPDWDAMRATPFAQIPCGSGNALAATAGMWTVASAVHAIVKAQQRPLDIATGAPGGSGSAGQATAAPGALLLPSRTHATRPRRPPAAPRRAQSCSTRRPRASSPSCLSTLGWSPTLTLARNTCGEWSGNRDCLAGAWAARLPAYAHRRGPTPTPCRHACAGGWAARDLWWERCNRSC